MDIRKLEYVIAIAEEKSLSKAAEKLFVTQSALSQTLAALKAEGLPPLFTYEKREMHLTDAGKIYVSSARAIIEIEKNAQAALKDLSMKHNRSFRIAVSPYLSPVLYLKVLPRLRRDFPRTTIHCSALENCPIHQDLENQKTDLAFYLSLYDSSKFLHFTVLRQEELVMVHLPGRSEKQAPLILPEQGSNLRDICNHALIQNGMTPEIYGESNDVSLALSLALAGQCTALLPRASVMDANLEISSFSQPCYFYLVAACRKNFHPSILETAVHMMRDFL